VTVSRQQRYSKARRCPICGGAEQDPREQGRRCIGYLSDDDEWARCSREECAGSLDLEKSTGCYVHKLYGLCKCGEIHNEGKTSTQNVIEATYDYCDEGGVLLYQVVRKAGKKFQQRRPDGTGGWIWKIGKDVRRVLYRLPELLAAPPDETVVIVEGEKDVATLVSRGIVATTNAGGASKWNSVADLARKVLAGRNVVIIADADAPGRKHAKDILSSLTGVAANVEPLEPTKGKDVTEHIANGGTYTDLVALGTGEAGEKPATSSSGGVQSGPPSGPGSIPPPPGLPNLTNGAIPVAPYKFKVGDHKELVDRLLFMLQNDSRVIITGDERELFGYNPTTGLYLLIGRSDQSRIVQTLSGSPVKGSAKPLKIQAKDVSGAQSLAYDRVERPGFFSEAPAGIAFSDGFVTLTEAGAGVLAHSPDNRARFGYPFPYAPEAPCPMWLNFLGEIFRDDDDRDQKIAVLQEHLGASLAGIATTYQRCIICIGEGDEGKSTLAKIVQTIFPPGSVEAVPPQEWGQEYRRAMLAGKLLNVVAELPESDIIASESFKAVVSGDPITGRHIRQEPFTYKPKAGHLFLANRLPGTPDQTRGFWRRFIVIRFNRNFSGDGARDPFIADRIIAAERSSLVSWALQGAVRLLAQKEYTLPTSHTKELAMWRKTADQIAAFFDDKVTFEVGRGTAASDAYMRYRDWAEANGHRSISSSKFSGRLRELGYAVKKTKTGNVYPILIAGCTSVPCDVAVGGPTGGGGGVAVVASSSTFPKDPSTLN
jgi:putative DNA primase/helicase